MKKILVIFFVFVLSASIIGCSTNTGDLRQAINIARELLTRYDEIISIYDLGNISDDESEIVLDEDGYEYFIVKSDKYKSIDDLKESTQQVLNYDFSLSYFYKAFCSEERPLYKEIGGNLCRASGEMAILYTPRKSGIIIHKSLKSCIVFSVPPTEGDALTKDHRYYFTLLNTHNGWRIDNVFELE